MHHILQHPNRDRTRVKQVHSSHLSSSKPDVFILLGVKFDLKVIIIFLKREPILWQVIELTSIDSLEHYCHSHNDDTTKIVYLVYSLR
jgi:hypothetical protein